MQHLVFRYVLEYLCTPRCYVEKEVKNQPKHPRCTRLEKDCDERDVKSKRDSQGLWRNAVDYIKNFDNDDPGASMLCGLGHHYQNNFDVISINPTQALGIHLLISYLFLQRPFQVSAATFLQLGCLWLELISVIMKSKKTRHYLLASVGYWHVTYYYIIHATCKTVLLWLLWVMLSAKAEI